MTETKENEKLREKYKHETGKKLWSDEVFESDEAGFSDNYVLWLENQLKDKT